MEQQIFQRPDWGKHHCISMKEEDGIKRLF